MSYELRNPKQLIQSTFSSNQIHAFYVSTFSLSGILAAASLVRWMQISFAHTKVTNESAALLQCDEDVQVS